MKMLTDILYILGNGSPWNNNEIRFSLRSIAQNGINAGKIFICGEFPDFLSDTIIHIPASDIFPSAVNADGNIIHKVLTACQDSRLSQQFLMINDDHILIKPIEISQIPSFHKGDMKSFPDNYWKGNYWRTRLESTMHILSSKGLPTLHYDCHTPIIFDKTIFQEIVGDFDYQSGIGYTMKSLYGNSVQPEGKLLTIEKRTVFEHKTTEELDSLLSKSTFLAFNDNGINLSLKKWLFSHFPAPSEWEIKKTDDKSIAVSEWLQSDCDFEKGCVLFSKYFSNKNLAKLFALGETPSLRKKMEYKFNTSLAE